MQLSGNMFLASGSKIFDVVVMMLCFTAAAFSVSSGLEVTELRSFLELRFSMGNIVLFSGFVVLWPVLFSSFRLYEHIQPSTSYSKAIAIVKATSIGTCAIVAVALPLDISFINVRFVLIFWLGITTLSVCGRLIARELLERFDMHALNSRKILIVGANARSIRLARQIQSRSEFGFELIGFVDETSTHASSFQKLGYSLVARLMEISDYLGKTEIDEVLLCLPVRSRYDDIAQVISSCKEQGITFGVLPDLFEWKLADSRIIQFGDQAIISVQYPGFNGVQAATKRAIDLGLSAVLIVLLLPVFILTAILIKLTVSGPVLFSQERIGQKKKRFRILKFRTMVSNAEQQQAELEHLNEATGPVFKIKHDHRITPIGRFLRRSSIDELPQLINVISGDMSLVGPRPLPVRDYDAFSEDWYRRRVSVRPGITGLWQVNGRDHSSFDDWMKLDLQYIDQWSLMLDLKVMIKTIPAVLKGSGQ